jgi:hypothetical protein
MLAMNSFRRTVFGELGLGELASSVGVEHPQLQTGLASARAWMSFMAAAA